MSAGDSLRVAVSAPTSRRHGQNSSLSTGQWPVQFTGWEAHIYPGLRLTGIALETRSGLARALGEVGTEAEYVLQTCAHLMALASPSIADGNAFFARLEASCQRLARVATSLEVATQSYLAAMETNAATCGATAEPGEEWWHDAAGAPPYAEPFDLRLRRCGFAYRHLVQLQVATHLDALLEHLATFLAALRRLPPAGVLPAADLYAGLYALSARIQGDVVLHHIHDLSASYPGLLTGIARLRERTLIDDTALESDLAWVYAQRAYALSQAHTLEHNDSGMPRQERAQLRAQALSAVAEWEAILHELARLDRRRR